MITHFDREIPMTLIAEEIEEERQLEELTFYYEATLDIDVHIGNFDWTEPIEVELVTSEKELVTEFLDYIQRNQLHFTLRDISTMLDTLIATELAFFISDEFRCALVEQQAAHYASQCIARMEGDR